MKPIRSTLLIALWLAVVASPVCVADGLAQIRAAGVFRIGTEGTYVPFTYHDEAGKLTGFDVELGTEIARRLGVKPQFNESRWNGLIAGLDVNRYDAVINEIAVTDARKLKYDYSDPYITSHAAIDDALADIRKDGTYAKISQKYFGRDVFQ